MPISLSSDVFHELHLPGSAAVPLIERYQDLAQHLGGGPLPSGAIAIPSGTPVIVLDDAATVVRVAVVRGAHRQRQGWVPSAWVRPPAAAAALARVA